MKHIVVCIPFAREFVYTQFFACWTKMFAYSSGKYTLSLVTIFGPYIDSNRDMMIAEALRMDADYVLFLDDDQTYPRDTPEVLLSHNKDVIGGVTPRKETRTPMLWDYRETVEMWNSLGGRTGVTKVAGMGMGGILIKADVFRKLKYPYFKRHTDTTYRECGEDIAFYLQCRDAGIDVWVDLDLQYGHLVVGEARLDS